METKTCPKKITPEQVRGAISQIAQTHSFWYLEFLHEDVAETLGLYEVGCEHLVEQVKQVVDEMVRNRELNVIDAKSGKKFVVFSRGNFLQVLVNDGFVYSKITDSPVSKFEEGALVSLDGKWAVIARDGIYSFVNGAAEIADAIGYFDPWAEDYLRTVWGL